MTLRKQKGVKIDSGISLSHLSGSEICFFRIVDDHICAPIAKSENGMTALTEMKKIDIYLIL